MFAPSKSTMKRESIGLSSVRLSESALLALDSAGSSQVASAINRFAELMRDPESDGVTKFAAGYYPNQPGVIETTNEDWYMAYTVLENNEIYISRLYLKSDLYSP